MPVPYQKHGRRHRPGGEDPIPGLGAVASGPYIVLELAAAQTITSGTAGDSLTWAYVTSGEGDLSVWADQYGGASILNGSGTTTDSGSWYTPTLLSGQQAVWVVSLFVQWEDPTVSCLLDIKINSGGQGATARNTLVYDGAANLTGYVLCQSVTGVTYDAYNPISIGGRALQNTGGDLDVTGADLAIFALPPII